MCMCAHICTHTHTHTDNSDWITWPAIGVGSKLKREQTKQKEYINLQSHHVENVGYMTHSLTEHIIYYLLILYITCVTAYNK